MVGAQVEIGFLAGKTDRGLHSGQPVQTGIYCPKEHGRAMIGEPEREQSFKIRQMSNQPHWLNGC